MKRLEIVNEKLRQTTQIGIPKTISDQWYLVDMIDGIGDGIPKTIQQQEHLLFWNHISHHLWIILSDYYLFDCALHIARSTFKNQRWNQSLINLGSAIRHFRFFFYSRPNPNFWSKFINYYFSFILVLKLC